MGKSNAPSQDSFFDGTNEVVDHFTIANLFCNFFNNKVMDSYVTSACENFIVPDLSSSNNATDNFISELELADAFMHLKPSRA